MKSAAQECLSEGVVVTPEVILVFHDTAGSNPAIFYDYNLTTFLLLDSLAEPAHHTETSDKSSAMLHAVEVKLDLLLQLVTQLLGQQQSLPSPQAVRLSAEGIEWRSAESPTPRGVVEIFLEPHLSRSIKLPVENSLLESQPGGSFRICSRFVYLDSTLKEHLEKWVFRCHRREVAMQRHAREAQET